MGLKAILDERIQHHNLWWVPPDAVVLLPVALAVRGGMNVILGRSLTAH